MQHSLDTPKSLTEYKKRGGEIEAFEGFKETEPNIHRGFKEVTRFDEQRVEFRAVAPRYTSHPVSFNNPKALHEMIGGTIKLSERNSCRLSVAMPAKLI